MKWTITTEQEARREDRLHDSQQPNFSLHQYLKDGRHYEGRPSYLTDRQLDVLMRYTPGPLGMGMDVRKIAKDLKVNRRTVQRIMKQLQEKFASAMDKVESMRSSMMREGFGFRHPRSYEGMLAALDEGQMQEMVKEIF